MTDATAAGYLAMLDEIERYWRAMSGDEQEQVSGPRASNIGRAQAASYAAEGWVRMLAREEIAKAQAQAPMPGRTDFAGSGQADIHDEHGVIIAAGTSRAAARIRELEGQVASKHNAMKLARDNADAANAVHTDTIAKLRAELETANERVELDEYKRLGQEILDVLSEQRQAYALLSQAYQHQHARARALEFRLGKVRDELWRQNTGMPAPKEDE